MILPAMQLTGAQVLLPGGLQDHALTIEGGQITDGPAARKVDLSGYMIMPGIIDIHGDGFERHLAPRRGAMKDIGQGLITAEAELAANGITTATLAQFYSWEGGMRGAEFASQVFSGIAQARPHVVTDLHTQLRFETPMLDDYDAVLSFAKRHNVKYLVFNDHLPHDILEKGKRPPRLTGQALRIGRNPEKHLEIIQNMHDRRAGVPAALDVLTAQLAGLGVLMGSHDDRTAQDRAIWAARGVHIAEFPETQDAAEAAHAAGGAVIMGAPNVVRGGSHNGNISALELVMMGLCDALASDYHYPSLKRAAFFLADGGVLSLAQAWGLISSGPARVLGLEGRGDLQAGHRADLVVLDAQTRNICATICAGRVSYMSGDVAARFVG